MIWRIMLDFEGVEDDAVFLMVLKMMLNMDDYAGF